MTFKAGKKEAMEAGLGLATIQMSVTLGDKDKNLAKTAELANKAVQEGVELLVYPELCNTGYVFNSRREAEALAEEVPGGPSTAFWTDLASRLNIYLVAGLIEKEKGKLYNTALLIGPEGLVGRYRKLHLFNIEKYFFEPGDTGLPVFHLPFGRVGMLICYDLRFFEAGRILALQGADLICVPTNWLVLFDRQGFDDKGYAMQHYAAMVMANTNSVFFACSNRIGRERGTSFFGKSFIVGPSGWPLKGPASDDSEEILVASVNLMEARTGKSKSGLNDVFRDRRHDVYSEMLGYPGFRFPY